MGLILHSRPLACSVSSPGPAVCRRERGGCRPSTADCRWHAVSRPRRTQHRDDCRTVATSSRTPTVAGLVAASHWMGGAPGRVTGRTPDQMNKTCARWVGGAHAIPTVGPAWLPGCLAAWLPACLTARPDFAAGIWRLHARIAGLSLPHRGLLRARTLATPAVEPQAVPASTHALLQQSCPVVPSCACACACACRASALACTGPRRRPALLAPGNPHAPRAAEEFQCCALLDRLTDGTRRFGCRHGRGRSRASGKAAAARTRTRGIPPPLCVPVREADPARVV